MSLWFFDGELNGAAKTTTHDDMWQVSDATCRAQSQPMAHSRRLSSSLSENSRKARTTDSSIAMTSVLEESGRPTKACGPMQAVAGHGEIKLRPTKWPVRGQHPVAHQTAVRARWFLRCGLVKARSGRH